MDQFFEKNYQNQSGRNTWLILYLLQKLNSLLKDVLKVKSPVLTWFNKEFYKTFKEIIQSLYLFQKIEGVFPNLIYKAKEIKSTTKITSELIQNNTECIMYLKEI